jgi:hypothetical protein
MTDIMAALTFLVMLSACFVAWDVLRKRFANEHTRLLAQDRYQEVQRACTTLELRAKALESRAETTRAALEELYAKAAAAKGVPTREEFDEVMKMARHAVDRGDVLGKAIENLAKQTLDELQTQRQKTDAILATSPARRFQGPRIGP